MNIWKLRHLKWCVMDRPTGDFTSADVDYAIEKALESWRRIPIPEPFTFTRIPEARAGEANLVFRAFMPPAFGFDAKGLMIESSHMPYFPDFDKQLVVALNMATKWSFGITVNSFNPLGAYAHGIGHALGMPHSERSDQLMSQVFSGRYTAPQVEDVQKFQQLYGGVVDPCAELKSQLAIAQERERSTNSKLVDLIARFDRIMQLVEQIKKEAVR